MGLPLNISVTYIYSTQFEACVYRYIVFGAEHFRLLCLYCYLFIAVAKNLGYENGHFRLLCLAQWIPVFALTAQFRCSHKQKW